MNNTWIVLKNEFINTVTRRSFLLTLILVPLVPALILGGISLFGGEGKEDALNNLIQPPDEKPFANGYIDQASIISEIPQDIEQLFLEYSNEEQAQQAVQAGEIQGYYLIQPDYLETGAIHYVVQDYSPLAGLENSELIEMVIKYNLLGADMKRLEVYTSPVNVEHLDLTPEETDRNPMDNPLAFYIPYGITMLFYIVIITSASLMMNSVAKEKENRVMEILMTSIKPKQLLTGKILGLGLAGLLQMAVWLGSAFLLLRLGVITFNIPPNLQLRPEIFFWGIAFFILGYLIYATIMAGVGALVPNVKEASQATFYVIIPILIPLMLISAIIEEPHATLSIVLSLIPFTAPNTIMTRLAVSEVPLWQLVTAIVLMVATIYLLIRAVSGMFRAQVLLTGQKFSPMAYFRVLLGKDLEAPNE
jgi:ABC-2 type transport system permease protein